MNKSSLISAATALAMALCAWLPARSADEMSAYLFAYFTGNSAEQEQICYAVSYDGFNYLPLNGGNPVIASSEIANTGSVRDPHILRGNDGYFYMVATDMKSSLGWQSNHGLVLMRSTDLINWTHHAIDFQVIYPDTKFANSKYVWAPQTIWDESVGKYMIYFAWGDGQDTGTGSSAHQIPCYVYANEDFTDLEKGADGKYVEPKVLFDRGFAAIDMDIVLDDNETYHCFYKDEATAKGITQCTFAKADLHDSSKWNYDYPKISYDEAAEGCGVFRLRDGSWCLMWDCYNNGHYCFTRSSDLNTFAFVQYTATSGNFTPRHGTVIQITRSELDALLKKYNTSSIDSNVLKDNRADWLKFIPDAEYVCNLSLPGSHDSGTIGLTSPANVQTLSIADQLANGVRVLDLRINSNLRIAHGIYYSSTTFDAALTDIENFLSDHPTEFVIAFTKAENVSDSNLDSWRSSVLSIVNNHASHLVPFHRNAMVGELRGKIMLLNRDKLDSNNTWGFADYWGDNNTEKTSSIKTNFHGISSTSTMIFQDYYNATEDGGAGKKDNAITDLLTKSKSTYAIHPTNMNWYLNFTSGYTETNLLGVSKYSSIQSNARRCNKLVIDNIKDAPGNTGMVLMDFACDNDYYGQNLVDALILNNSQYINNGDKVATIYNVGQNEFINQGGSWDTRAILNHVPAPVQISSANGISSFHIIDLTNGDKKWLGPDNYFDNTKTNWNITTHDNGLSSITLSENLLDLGWDGSLLNTGINGENSLWKIKTYADIIKEMPTASKTNGVDVTILYIMGSTYGRYNTIAQSCWEGDVTARFTESTSDSRGGVIEMYNKDFDYCQTAYLPKGMYRLTVDGFYRYGDKANAISARENGTETINAYLYAGNDKASLMSILDGKDVTSNNIVNDIGSASGAIKNGVYDCNELYFYVPSDQCITFGIKNESHYIYDWCAFNNFGLIYFGPDKFSALITDADRTSLANAIAEAETHKLGFDKDEYAPYTNESAVKALAFANTITSESSFIDFMKALGGLESAVWTPNAEELNAVCDGDFEMATRNKSPLGWYSSTHSLGGNYHARNLMDQRNFLNDCNKGFYLRFDGTNSTKETAYGYPNEDLTYLMPLKKDVTYTFSCDFGGWGQITPTKFSIVNELGNTIESITQTPTSRIDDNATGYNHVQFDFTPSSDGNYGIKIENAETSSNNCILLANVSILRAKPSNEMKASRHTSLPAGYNTNFFAGNATDGYEAEKVVLTDGYVYGNEKEIACDDITYVRDFLNTNWQALYVPFTVDAAVVAEQGRLVQLASVENTDDGYVLHFNAITSGTLAANTPYIFKPAKTGEMTFYAASNLQPTVENSIAHDALTLYGTYQGKTDMFTSKAYGLANDKFMRAESDAATLKPFRIYLMLNSSAQQMPSQIRVQIDDEETNALDDALFFSDDQGTCYDLQGRIVKNPNHGIIIQNGKKKVVK